MNRSANHQPGLFAEEELPPNTARWEQVDRQDRLFAELVFNLPLDTTYHYLVPATFREQLAVGMRVEVPFGRGNKPTRGYVVGLTREAPAHKNFKSISALLDREPLVTAEMLDLTRWIGRRYFCSWGQVLDSVIPAGVKSGAGMRELLVFQPAEDLDERLQRAKLPARQAVVLDILRNAGRPMRGDELAEAAQCSPAPIQGLRTKGLIVAVRQTFNTTELSTLKSWETPKELVLNADQQRATSAIIKSVHAREARTFLLHGVTGSGKTEVYIRAIEEIVKHGRQAIVLVPEISLTPQTIRRFSARFQSVAVLHSHLTDAERHTYWQQIQRGEVEVIVGARSAIFAPAPHLGLIVIDEEHETSFKQDSTPRYHAREVAKHRSETLRIPLVLGSATPTLETFLGVVRKSETLLAMPRRVAGLPLPPVVIVDTRNDPVVQKGGSIGRALFTAMQSALKQDGQIILFLNVRGFSPAIFCRACGQSVRCPDCDITLTYHKQRKIALCHSCDYEISPPTHCPNCTKPGLLFLGQGTERLEAEVRSRFPDIPCLRMDSDTMQKRGSHDLALEQFRHGQVKILLGTQMIAKGLDFPNVTLVGVVDADTSLHQPDFRASERTFQLIAQVAGRTGRSTRGGRVLVQTASPTQPAIQCASQHDYLKFAREELAIRQSLAVPPFAVMIRFIFRGPAEKEVEAAAIKVRELLGTTAKHMGLFGDPHEMPPSKIPPLRMLGPAPCPVTRLKTLYRYHLQLSHPDRGLLEQLWNEVHGSLPDLSPVEMSVDVDPMNLR